jgi:CDGSH-type Zn-finger protein
MFEAAKDMKIVVRPDGPYIVTGGVPLSRGEIVVNESGESIAWREIERIPVGETYSLCRCGKSANKPLCDGSHFAEGFDGTETAERSPYAEQASCTNGPGLKLLDARNLCAEARFCDRAGGLWNLISRCDEPGVLALAEEEAALCPSGAVDLAHRGSVARCGRRAVGARRDSRRVGRRHPVRGPQPCDALPLRRVEEQAVLRRLAHRCGVQGPLVLASPVAGSSEASARRSRAPFRRDAAPRA